MASPAARFSYPEAIRRFGRNARLRLVCAVLSNVNSSIFPVAGAFSMEVVDGQERATTAEFTHAAFDLFCGSTIIVGALLAAGGFWLAFVLAGILYALHAIPWHAYFRGHPVELASRAPTGAGAAE